MATGLLPPLRTSPSLMGAMATPGLLERPAEMFRDLLRAEVETAHPIAQFVLKVHLQRTPGWKSRALEVERRRP